MVVSIMMIGEDLPHKTDDVWTMNERYLNSNANVGGVFSANDKVRSLQLEV